MKTAIYCRLSEEDNNKRSKNDDSESIQNQKAMLIQYAVEKNWEIYQIYSDDDYTGADRNRPAFNQLLKDAEARKFNIILCKSQSRFTRELELVERYIHDLFLRWNIRFVSVVDNADTEVKGNKKARQINGLINEWYLEDLSDNIKSVFRTKKENGLHIGSFALYGYIKDPDKKGHLIIDEEAAQVVREVFALFSQGYGKTAIARILNDREIPNPTEYKRLKGLRYAPAKSKNSTLWRYFAISDMLVNEMYIGNMVQGKYGSISYKSKINKPVPKEKWIKKDGTHEPIIDMELWNRVQELIKERAKPFSGDGKTGIFANKVKCKSCGYTMRSKKCRDKHYLACGTRNISKEACIGSFIPVERLEKTIIAELNILAEKYLDKSELEQKAEFDSNIKEKIEKIKADIDMYTKKSTESDKAIRALYMDKVRGIITEDEFINFSKDFHEDKKRLEKLIKSSEEEIAALESRSMTMNNRRCVIEQHINTDKLEREHIDALIECIYIGKKDAETKILPIEISWAF